MASFVYQARRSLPPTAAATIGALSTLAALRRVNSGSSEEDCDVDASTCHANGVWGGVGIHRGGSFSHRFSSGVICRYSSFFSSLRSDTTLCEAPQQQAGIISSKNPSSSLDNNVSVTYKPSDPAEPVADPAVVIGRDGTAVNVSVDASDGKGGMWGEAEDDGLVRSVVVTAFILLLYMLAFHSNCTTNHSTKHHCAFIETTFLT